MSLTGADIIARLLSTVLSVYIARSMGASVFGQLAFAIAFTNYFNLFSDFGLTTLGIREIARDKSQTPSFATNITALQVWLSLILIGVLGGLLFFMPLEINLKWLTFLVGLSMLPGAFSLTYVFQAYEKMEFTALVRILTQILTVVTAFALIYFTKNILALPIVQFLVGLLSALLIYYLLKRFIYFSWSQIEFAKIRFLFRLAIPFVISGLAIQIYYSLDSIILQFLKGSTVVGYYSAGYKVVLLLIGFAGFFQTAIYPTLTNFLKADLEKANELVARTSKLLIFICLPIAVGGTVLAPKIISFLYGNAYTESILPFQILIWSIFTIYVNVSFGATLLAAGRERQYTKSAVMGAALNLIFNLVLIPKFSLVGAAIATMITEFYVLISLYYYSSKVIKVSILKNLIQAFFTAVAMGAILVFLDLNVLVLITLGAVLYFSAVFIFRFLDKNDFDFILTFFRERGVIHD